MTKKTKRMAIFIRVTEDEKNGLVEEAKKRRQSLSAFIMSLFDDYKNRGPA